MLIENPSTVTITGVCEHNYTYKGVVYKTSDYPIPGSSARNTHYFDEFFCTKCLDFKHFQLEAVTTTYENIKFNATPKVKP